MQRMDPVIERLPAAQIDQSAACLGNNQVAGRKVPILRIGGNKSDIQRASGNP